MRNRPEKASFVTTEAPDITHLFPETQMLFRDDAYQGSARAKVLGAAGDQLVLDATLFYAASGGQSAELFEFGVL